MLFTLLAGDKKVTLSHHAIVKSSQLVRDYLVMVDPSPSNCSDKQTDTSNSDSCSCNDNKHLQSVTQPQLELQMPQSCQHYQMIVPDRYVNDIDEYACFLLFQYNNDTKVTDKSNYLDTTDDINNITGSSRKSRKKRNKKRNKSKADSILNEISSSSEHKTLEDKVELKFVLKRLELADYLQADDYFTWCLESCLFRYWSDHIGKFYSTSISYEVLERIVICLPYVYLPQSYRDDMNFMVRWVRHNLNKRVVFDGEYCHHIIATKYKSDDTEEVTQFILTGSTDNDSGVRDVWLDGYSSNYNAIYDQSIKFRDNKVEFIYNSTQSPPIRSVIINSDTIISNNCLMPI